MMSSRRQIVEVMEHIVRERYTCRSFRPNVLIPPAVIRRVLELSLRAPTSFNLQPYKLIVVQDAEYKERVAQAMIGGNAKTVRDSSATVVFLADKGSISHL